MSAAAVRVRVPATTANLGPGFDTLGLALDLWNEAEFRLEGQAVEVQIEGEGATSLPRDGDNLTARAFYHYYQQKGLPHPGGLQVKCLNRIPSGSGLGSSASAVILGLLAAARLSGCRVTKEELLALAVDLEGHGDNAAAALFGGLTVALQLPAGWVVRRFDVPPLRTALAFPDIHLPTSVARQALPATIQRSDAVFNSSRTPMVVEALRSGDLDLLGLVMDDRLHQPYRLPLIRGASEAMLAARQAGASGVAISGAGPSLIAFCRCESQPIAEAMCAAFGRAGVAARAFCLTATSRGAELA